MNSSKPDDIQDLGDAIDPNASHNMRRPSDGFRPYRRRQIAELRPYEAGETLGDRVSISPADRDAGAPRVGDMIARNPKNHDDQWLVAAAYFADNFEPVA